MERKGIHALFARKLFPCFLLVYLLNQIVVGRSLKTDDSRKYSKLQIDFAGNLTTMRHHFSRSGMSHWTPYEARCLAKDIKMHELAMPSEEKARREAARDGVEQYVSFSFFVFSRSNVFSFLVSGLCNSLL